MPRSLSAPSPCNFDITPIERVKVAAVNLNILVFLSVLLKIWCQKCFFSFHLPIYLSEFIFAEIFSNQLKLYSFGNFKITGVLFLAAFFIFFLTYLVVLVTEWYIFKKARLKYCSGILDIILQTLYVLVKRFNNVYFAPTCTEKVAVLPILSKILVKFVCCMDLWSAILSFT